jgi:NAD(P)-dependent dehydrogenase (short-subunit alcohol dehydrogenase family)
LIAFSLLIFEYALPYMAKIGGASVINQSSAAGLVGIRGSAAYCASKAGVIALTKVAALEYARYKIRVNCICPGLINTPMSQELLGGELDPNDPDAIRRVSVMGRIGRPEEIAKMALFLASEDSSYATGACFVRGRWMDRFLIRQACSKKNALPRPLRSIRLPTEELPKFSDR